MLTILYINCPHLPRQRVANYMGQQGISGNIFEESMRPDDAVVVVNLQQRILFRSWPLSLMAACLIRTALAVSASSTGGALNDELLRVYTKLDSL